VMRTLPQIFLCFGLLLSQLSPVHAQPAAPNRVLELDGNGSYVELPTSLFTNLEAATIELWVWVENYVRDAHFLQFGQPGHELYLAQDMEKETLKLLYTDGTTNRHRITQQGLVEGNRWFHTAVVLTGTGAQLYFNGVLVGTNRAPVVPKALDPTDNVLGRSVPPGGRQFFFRGRLA